MAKGFTVTILGEQDWYVALPNKYKLFFNYIKDKCDDSGVWRPNKELIQRIISEPINLNEFLVFVNTEEKERILVLSNGKWFLKDYFFFQYGDKFNPHSPVHRGVLKRMVSHGVHIKELSKVFSAKLVNADFQILRQIAYDYPINNLLIEYGYPINRVKDKDKDKEYIKSIRDNSTLSNLKTLRGEKFSENFELVFFEDGSEQELGEQQKELATNGRINPKDIIKGSIY